MSCAGLGQRQASVASAVIVAEDEPLSSPLSPTSPQEGLASTPTSRAPSLDVLSQASSDALPTLQQLPVSLPASLAACSTSGLVPRSAPRSPLDMLNQVSSGGLPMLQQLQVSVTALPQAGCTGAHQPAAAAAGSKEQSQPLSPGLRA